MQSIQKKKRTISNIDKIRVLSIMFNNDDYKNISINIGVAARHNFELSYYINRVLLHKSGSIK